MADGDELAPGAIALRLPTVRQVSVSGEQRQPRADAFALSPPERAQRARGERVRVSVWDRARITVAEARRWRGDRPDVLVFELDVDVVREIAAALEHPELRVVEDRAGAPDDAPEVVRAAHAGISGLDAEPPGHPNRRLLNDARDALARACREVRSPS